MGPRRCWPGGLIARYTVTLVSGTFLWVCCCAPITTAFVSRPPCCGTSHAYPSSKRCSRPRRHHVAMVASESGLHPLPTRLASRLAQLQGFSDLRSKSMLLVKMGDEFGRREHGGLPPHLLPLSRKVRGCTAEVRIAVVVRRDPDTLLPTVHLGGKSDARLTRGMLAMLVDGLEGESADAILGLDGGVVAQAVGNQAGLTDSRINGLGNILNSIQDQVRERLRAFPSVGARVAALAEGAAAAAASEARQCTGATSSSSGSEAAVVSLASGASPWPNSHEEIAVLLSGGVDSSVALNLLLEQGHKVRAFYLKIWLEDELAHLGECPWEEDLSFAQAVCDQAGVPLEVVSLQQEYWDLVVGYTVAEARAGRTPNPDIMCNNRIKFGMFFEYVGRHFKRVATGHYAVAAHPDSDSQLEGGEAESRLLRSPDPVKDQTYFLCGLSQAQLSRALFPVGALKKEEVRQKAQRFNLPTKSRPDSQGICFLGKLKFEDFLRAHLGESQGAVVELGTNAIIGQHRGLWFHTIGQRKGVGPVLYPTEVHRGPWYVAGKHMAANELVVTNDYGAIDEQRTQFRVEGLHWVSPRAAAHALASGAELVVKTRHGPKMQRCTLAMEDVGGVAGGGAVEQQVLGTSAMCTLLDAKDSGLAPGQFAAFYDDQVCLGSGVIAVS